MLGILTQARAAEVRRLLSAPEPAALRTWALELLTDAASPAGVCAAVCHPLGFVCIPAYRAEGWGLCLHIWGAVRPDPAAVPSIHSHTWDLASYVLCGGLENQVVDVASAADDATHRILQISSIGPLDVIEPTDRLVRCLGPVATRIGPGGRYGLPARVFHTTIPRESGLTATVVLGENRYEPPEFVLGPLDSSLRVMLRPSCAFAELRELARSAIDEITRF